MGTLTVTAAMAFCTVCLQPTTDVIEDRVGLIEVNHYYDLRGQHILDQVIFYDWSPEGRFHVCDWRLLKQCSQVPQWDWDRGGFVMTWHDGKILRQVRGPDMRETWTQYDPEVKNREFLPRCYRRELPQE